VKLCAVHRSANTVFTVLKSWLDRVIKDLDSIRDMNADVDVTQLLESNHVLVQGLQGLAYR
jgi:hypothetical protein